MAIQKVLANRVGCTNCQKWLLRSFVASIGGHRLSATVPGHRAFATTARKSNDHSSSGISWLNDEMQRSHEGTHKSGSDTVISKSDSESVRIANKTTSEQTVAPSYVPWYLQDQKPDDLLPHPSAAGQEPPKIPPHPPEILEPLVNHVLSTLGLTHLKLLDLRRMNDPTPALGANLFMLVATARSERHLHASADKLCRWLRTEYKLTPFADGLLGRNEMKIALRRRAKKAKMMSAVGVSKIDDSELGEGIRSGWVCVNVGRVPGGVMEEVKGEDEGTLEDGANAEETASFEEAASVADEARLGAAKSVEDEVDFDDEDEGGILGFGTRTDSSAIVVQMLTEEKREEMGLEKLWEGAWMRQTRKAQAEAQAVEQEKDMEEGKIVATRKNKMVELADKKDTASNYQPFGENAAAFASSQLPA